MYDHLYLSYLGGDKERSVAQDGDKFVYLQYYLNILDVIMFLYGEWDRIGYRRMNNSLKKPIIAFLIQWLQRKNELSF